MGITADEDGNVYATGAIYGSVDFDERNPGTINYTTIYNDGFIAKYNVNGDLVWSHLIHGEGGDKGYGICLSQSNDIVIVGGTEGCRFTNGGTLYPGNGRNDGFVAKYDRISGSLIWAKVFGGDIDEWNTSVDVDMEGNIYVGGAFSSSSVSFDPGDPTATITKSSGGTYSTDAYLLKLGHDGSFKWANSTQSIKDEVINSVKVDDSGYVYATGRFGEGLSVPMSFSPGFNSGEVHNSAGGVDIFILKTNNDGALRWSGTYGTDAVNDNGASLYVNDKFEIFFSGLIGKTTRFGPVDIDSATGQDNALGAIINSTSNHNTSTFFMKFFQYEKDSVPGPTSLEDGLRSIGLRIYPNPANNVIYVEAERPFKRMVIYDVSGRTILHQEYERPKALINIKHLPPSQYFLNIISENGSSSCTTFIKE